MSALQTSPLATSVKAKPVPTPEVTVPQRFVLEGVSWDEYELFCKACDERAGLRLTYDGGNLELMTTSGIHEEWKSVLGSLLVELMIALRVPYRCLGNATWRRAAVQNGLEADNCYYIQSIQRIQGVINPDLDRHPPPDLAIEIEVSHSVLDRLAIYARLRVPEVWRFDGAALTVLVLQANGQYVEQSTSVALPQAPFAEIVRLIHRVGRVDEMTLVLSFREWLAQNLPTPPTP